MVCHLRSFRRFRNIFKPGAERQNETPKCWEPLLVGALLPTHIGEIMDSLINILGDLEALIIKVGCVAGTAIFVYRFVRHALGR